MEKKTIGSFIATLRKANGMTQKELAEKLNVSDKTVSRWERDESAPDLTLIPVIAEIFDVSSDELLRGEKRSLVAESDGSEKLSAKSEKQLKYMINNQKTKLQVRSFISIGIAIVGFIVAMICNFQFWRSNLGFMLGSIFFVAAILCESIFYCLAQSAVQGNEFNDSLLLECRFTLLNITEKTISAIVVLLVATIPLVLQESYGGDFIGLEAWKEMGIPLVISAILVCTIICNAVNKYFEYKNLKLLTEKEQEVRKKLLHLKKSFFIITVSIVLLTGCARYFVTSSAGVGTTVFGSVLLYTVEILIMVLIYKFSKRIILKDKAKNR